jgi:hypothetical protein
LKKNDGDQDKSFFKDLVFDSFLTEERKMFFWCLEEITSNDRIDHFKVFLEINFDLWTLFKSNIIFTRPVFSDDEINNKDDEYRVLWKEHNKIIDVVKSAFGNASEINAKGQFIEFLNEYLKALHYNISCIETFEECGDHKFIQSMISKNDMKERVEEIKNKIDSLTPPAS